MHSKVNYKEITVLEITASVIKFLNHFGLHADE